MIYGDDDFFFEKYKPVKNHLVERDRWEGCLFETFGEEIDYVQSMAIANERKVWTLIEGEEGMYILAGFHSVNRQGFFISEKEWETKNEEYGCDIIDDEEEDKETHRDMGSDLLMKYYFPEFNREFELYGCYDKGTVIGEYDFYDVYEVEGGVSECVNLGDAHFELLDREDIVELYIKEDEPL
jgi:hypothetical protein